MFTRRYMIITTVIYASVAWDPRFRRTAQLETEKYAGRGGTHVGRHTARVARSRDSNTPNQRTGVSVWQRRAAADRSNEWIIQWYGITSIDLMIEMLTAIAIQSIRTHMNFTKTPKHFETVSVMVCLWHFTSEYRISCRVHVRTPYSVLKKIEMLNDSRYYFNTPNISSFSYWYIGVVYTSCGQ